MAQPSKGRRPTKTTKREAEPERRPVRKYGERDLPSRVKADQIPSMRVPLALGEAVRKLREMLEQEGVSGGVSDYLRILLTEALERDHLGRQALAHGEAWVAELDEKAKREGGDWTTVVHERHAIDRGRASARPKGTRGRRASRSRRSTASCAGAQSVRDKVASRQLSSVGQSNGFVNRGSRERSAPSANDNPTATADKQSAA